MRYFFIFFLLQILPDVSAQSKDAKRGNTWIVGYRRSPATQTYLAKFDFNADTMQLGTFDTNVWLEGASSMICDTAGNLLLYFTGCAIANAQSEIIENGNNMPPTAIINDLFCPDNYSMSQTLLMLPDPGSDSLYFSFITGIHYQSGFGTYSYGLYMSKMSQYEVYEKNTLLIPDTVFSGHLAACRHANGRDWWIILNRLKTNRYYKILIDPAGAHDPFVQDIGLPSTKPSNGSGQAIFSPDGNKYVRFSNYEDLFVFDFDRCTGVLSNFQDINIEGNSEFSLSSGVAMSPNSRFVYTFGGKYCYQVDLQEQDVQGSVTLVGEWDGTLINNTWATYFDESALAPDGKIYGSVPGSNPYMHIIHSPNEKGLACNLEQHALLLPHPVWNTSTVPNMPNYRLGSVEGSACDTIATAVNEVHNNFAWNLQAQPNPNNGSFQITLPPKTDNYRLYLYDLTGRMVQHQTIDSGEQRLSINLNLTQGAYLLRVLNSNGRLLGQEIVLFEKY